MVKNDQKKIMKKALRLHSQGKIEEALSLYNNLIENKFTDYRLFTNVGTIYQQLKKNDLAFKYYQQGILKFPKNPEAYSNLGRMYCNFGKLQIGKKYIEKAIELKPDFLIAISNLVFILINEGKLKEAEIELKKILNIDPKNENSLINLGCVLKELNNLDEAEKIFKKALAYNPNHINIYINLGSVLRELKKLDEAEEILNKGMKLDSSSEILLNNLANVLIDKNRFIEAEKYILKSIKLKPNYYLGYVNLATIFSFKNNLFEAEKCLHKALKFNPKCQLIYLNLANIKMDLGKSVDSEILFLKAIELDDIPYAYSCLFRLYEKNNDLEKLKIKLDSLQDKKFLKNELFLYNARLNFRQKKFKDAKTIIDRISDQWIEKTHSSNQIFYWSFKAFIEDKNKNYDTAFNCFTKSQLNDKYKICDPKKFLNYINDYKKNLNRTNLLDFNTSKYKNIAFLIGFPRSGTTLLDTILRSHPNINVIEEKTIIQSIENLIITKYGYSLDKIYDIKKNQLEFLREYYVKERQKYCSAKDKILIDKFPFQTVSLPLINLLFPQAKIIFAHRHPYDTVLSCFQQAFLPNNAMSNLRSINSTAKIYDLTMTVWIDYKNKLNLDYIMSKYEDLVEDFENHILKILVFLNLEWHPNVKNYINTALKRVTINTPSSSQVIQPIYKTSMGKWKNYQKYFKESNIHLDKWVDYFNY